MIKVLFVCLGNICRSPTAEGVFRKLVEAGNLQQRIEADSAGTHAYHLGEPPDARAQATAARRGADLSAIRGRRATAKDFHEFDYILAMDRQNLDYLQAQCPEDLRHKIRLFMEFASGYPNDEVPDPYFGGTSGFDQVLDMIEDAAMGLLREIRRERVA
ncbi:MAG: low molecular weight protein-tyrosine-phosphatase [Gammaproteobacteria bacterium]|nr:MAG: low molecular weight protein-tyrosine-phosphatase [Gammaproteobacteria bacterium]